MPRAFPLSFEGKRTSPYSDFYNAPDERRWGRAELAIEIPGELWPPGSRILEVGCGLGPATIPECFNIAIDISHPALTRVQGVARVQADAARLPFRSNSLTGYLSIATYEHLPRPDLALDEMDRVLVAGGLVFLAPAWHARKWTASGVTVRSYGELPWKLRLLKLSLLVRERLWWRAMFLLPQRVLREVKAAISRRNRRLEFKPLEPNLDDYLTSDSDASASIDSHSAIVSLRSLGYEVQSHPTLGTRLLARHQPVIAVKASRSRD